jgi:hypothetical protein
VWNDGAALVSMHVARDDCVAVGPLRSFHPHAAPRRSDGVNAVGGLETGGPRDDNKRHVALVSGREDGLAGVVHGRHLPAVVPVRGVPELEQWRS